MKTIFCLILLAASAAAQTPCKPGVQHRKLDHTATQNTQVAKVNSYKEPWRLEAKEVAERECKSLAHAPGVTEVSSTERKKVFACAPLADAGYEVIVEKPEWLLPYSGTYRTMMWVVTGVNNCNALLRK